MDPSNQVVKLCVAGARAEFEKRPDAARAFYQQAWQVAQDDYECCIAAHYVARFQDTPEESLRWNQEALDRANAVGDARVAEFYPSLYLNMGQSYEQVGNQAEAERYYALAAGLGFSHMPE